MGEARQAVETFWHMMETGDLDHVDEVLCDDLEFTMPGVALKGIDAMRGLRDQWWTAFPDLHHVVSSAVETDGHIALEISMQGTHDGTMLTPNGTIPASHHKVLMPSADFVFMRGGKIARWHAYPDMLGLLAQLGAGAAATA